MLCRRMNRVRERSMSLQRRMEFRRRLKSRTRRLILAMAVVERWLVCVVFLSLVSFDRYSEAF